MKVIYVSYQQLAIRCPLFGTTPDLKGRNHSKSQRVWRMVTTATILGMLKNLEWEFQNHLCHLFHYSRPTLPTSSRVFSDPLH